jgi:tetratricopeptide (TPR) repeat protein
MTPPLQALLGKRVKQDTLIPFAKMHPSIALLPTAEDAATAFAEVFYAIDLLEKQWGPQSLRTVIAALRDGKTDKAAVEAATGKPFPAFEKAWLAHVRKQKFPLDLLPMTNELVVLKDDKKGKGSEADTKRKGREISFGEFDVVQEPEAQKFAHLGELMRERNRPRAAAEELGKAHRIVGDRYEVVSNKYALALFEIGEVAKAEEVLSGSLKLHPGTASTLVHLGRVYLARRDFQKAKQTFLEALAVDPFDPEIHVTLVAIETQLGEPALAARAREASAILTGLPADQIDKVAEVLLRRSGAALANADVTESPAGPAGAPAPSRPDGGP